MPVIVGGSEQLPNNKANVRLPEGYPDNLADIHGVTISREIPNNSPACYENWDELSLEEQSRIISRYRYMGIRLRHDLKDMTVPISRERMELP